MKIGSIADQAGELAFWAVVGISVLAFILLGFIARAFEGSVPDDGYGDFVN